MVIFRSYVSLPEGNFSQKSQEFRSGLEMCDRMGTQWRFLGFDGHSWLGNERFHHILEVLMADFTIFHHILPHDFPNPQLQRCWEHRSTAEHDGLHKYHHIINIIEIINKLDNISQHIPAWICTSFMVHSCFHLFSPVFIPSSLEMLKQCDSG